MDVAPVLARCVFSRMNCDKRETYERFAQRFDELCHLLCRLGFDERIRASHHIFSKSGLDDSV